MLPPQKLTFARLEFPDDKSNVLETDQHLQVEQDGEWSRPRLLFSKQVEQE